MCFPVAESPCCNLKNSPKASMSGSEYEKFLLALLRSAPLFGKLSLLHGGGELSPRTKGFFLKRCRSPDLKGCWHEGLRLVVLEHQLRGEAVLRPQGWTECGLEAKLWRFLSKTLSQVRVHLDQVLDEMLRRLLEFHFSFSSLREEWC